MEGKSMKNKNKKPSSLPLKITATYQPSKYGTDRVLHVMLRYLILLTAVIGMGVAGNEMLGLRIGIFDVALASVYTFTTFYILFKSLRGLIAGAVIGVGGMLILLKSIDLSIKRLSIATFNRIFNSVLYILRQRGYETVGELDITSIPDFCVMLPITALAALVVGISCRKKTRTVPYAVMIAAPAIFFMITGGSVQLRYFAPAVAATCAMAVMELAEKGVKDIFRSSFVGFTAFVLASVLMLTPIVNTKRAMDPITFSGFEGIIEILTPDGPENNVKRSVSPKRNVFKDKKIMTVYANTSSPLYLRSWAGGKFAGESWYSVDYDYGYSYADFIRWNDYFGLTKKFIESAELLGYGREQIGVGLSDVRISLAVKQTNLPLPSTSGRTGNLYHNGKTQQVSYIYDGVSTLGSLWKGDIYTTAAVIDDYDNKLLPKVIYGYLEYLIGYGAHDIFPTSSIGRRFASRFYKYGNDEYIEISQKYTSFAKSAYGNAVEDEAIDRAVSEIIEKYDILEYYDRLYSADSLSVTLTDGIVVDGYIYKLNNRGMAHASVIGKVVAEYLSDGRRYTTNPKSTGKSVTEELLFGSREGYCVQFATVGALIMRRLGFYTRYAEGYLVQNFKGSGSDYDYESKVTDRDGHAWCEVWVDCFGWMPLEMTPGFGGSTVQGTTKPPETTPPETSDTPIVTTPPATDTMTDTTENPPVTTPNTTTDRVSDTTERDRDGERKTQIDPVPIIIGALALILLIALASSVISTAVKRKKRLDGLINRALRGNLNSEERRIVACELEKALASALSTYKALPTAGEMPEGYGLRLEKTLVLNGLDLPLSLCVSALVRQAYGFGMDENDIKISALTLRALRMNALRKVGMFKYIICKIKGVL